MPRRTHPRVRSKHDRALIRHHAERVATNRWRELKARYDGGSYRWMHSEDPPLHPEEARVQGLAAWEAERAKRKELEVQRARLSRWEKHVQWSIMVPEGPFGKQAYPPLYSARNWTYSRRNVFWPFMFPDNLMATRPPLQCGTRCGCCAWEKLSRKCQNRQNRYGVKGTHKAGRWRIEAFD